jgi:hypothetical protein
MSFSPFFHQLSSAYQAEMDDLNSDSEGKNVLLQRLAAKRKELTFLRQMIETSPEMVAVVFNQAFQFKRPSVMDDLVSRESDELPDWDSLADTVVLQPWAQALAQEILKEPMGGWLLTVAAGLEYLYAKPGKHAAPAHDADGDEDRDADDADTDTDDHRGQDPSDDPFGDANDERSAHRREEAGQDWMESQGFDRKDH